MVCISLSVIPILKKDLYELKEACKSKNITFNVSEGKIVGLVGANGSGKTTTIKSILNLIKIDNGKIRPSKKLQDTLYSMLQGNQEFFLLDEQKTVYETGMAASCP